MGWCRVYDAADRPTSGCDGTGEYTYDQLGRQLTVPAVDALSQESGGIALGYFDDDSARSITQGQTVLSYALDVSGRRETQTTTTGGSVTGTVVNHYVDGSDSPGWITHVEGGSTSTTVYADLVAGDLSMSIVSDDAGSHGEVAIVTPRGDVAATVTIPSHDASAGGGLIPGPASPSTARLSGFNPSGPQVLRGMATGGWVRSSAPPPVWVYC